MDASAARQIADQTTPEPVIFLSLSGQASKAAEAEAAAFAHTTLSLPNFVSFPFSKIGWSGKECDLGGTHRPSPIAHRLSPIARPPTSHVIVTCVGHWAPSTRCLPPSLPRLPRLPRVSRLFAKSPMANSDGADLNISSSVSTSTGYL